MCVLRRVFFNASFKKDALTERQAGQADEVLVRAARDGAELGLQVDLTSVGGSEVEEKASGVIDELGSCRRKRWSA